MKNLKKKTISIITVCSVFGVLLLLTGTLWVGQSTKKDTDKAVRTVSLLYLDELAGRREQVVENNLKSNIQTIRVAMDLLTEEDLSDKAHLEAYQFRMKKLYELDKFAFVDTDGLIYTSTGVQNNIDEYGFDYKTISGPEISVLHPEMQTPFSSTVRITQTTTGSFTLFPYRLEMEKHVIIPFGSEWVFTPMLIKRLI
ncbi:MAG: hypothetical protein E7294_15935 [Lachnospiraceae bacterium]|nr:hypothetical protein [Lachnospiraceae bacterium]